MLALFWLWIVFVFLFGACLGSFLNVCAWRLPYEKSVLWPGSRCPSCLQPIHGYDNLPLLSYWLLRGRCRACGATFSIRYFLVELFTGLCFVGIYYLDIILNVSEIPFVHQQGWFIQQGLIPPYTHMRLWAIFLWHVTLFSFLLVASLTDLEHMEIPLSVTITGTIVGLAGSALLAWPFPNDKAEPLVKKPASAFQLLANVQPAPNPTPGLYPWPVWYPMPAWLAPGSWQLGLATGLVGALVGMTLLRGIRFFFGLGRGIEGLGLGDADLMMMAGSFLGWQPILAGFVLGVFAALVFGILRLILTGSQELAFGPALATGVMLAVYLWPRIAALEQVRELLFDARVITIFSIAGAVFLLGSGFLLRLLRGVPSDPAPV